MLSRRTLESRSVKQHTPENELLLLCARTRLNEPLVKHVRFLANNNKLDWEVLYQTAERHRVLPLLYKSLQSYCLNLIP